jgi:16S rRNA (guanine1207-N2)-methyltransferase
VWVCAHGGAFAGTRIDIGTRFLLSHLDEAAPAAGSIVDRACGTGVLAAALALCRPEARVIASDQSAAAATSTRATVEANGVSVRVEVRREDAGEGIPDAWADLVVLNPPFHNGAALDLRIGRMLVAAAARILRPGGELWTVYNSHLDYRTTLSRVVGPTRQVDRNRKFTITASTRASA